MRRCGRSPTISSASIRKLSGQEYVDEYAQKVKAELKARQEAEAATAGEGH